MRALVLAQVLALSLMGTPALADPPLTAEAFDALTQGRTMTWAEFGSVYGVEQYLPGRRVRWTVLGDDCTAGHWYAEGAMICFVYEDRPDPICWEMTQSATGLLARHSSRPAGAEPVVIEDSAEDMACFGPEVGV
jgi:hypothetical protein